MLGLAGKSVGSSLFQILTSALITTRSQLTCPPRPAIFLSRFKVLSSRDCDTDALPPPLLVFSLLTDFDSEERNRFARSWRLLNSALSALITSHPRIRLVSLMRNGVDVSNRLVAYFYWYPIITPPFDLCTFLWFLKFTSNLTVLMVSSRGSLFQSISSSSIRNSVCNDWS